MSINIGPDPSDDLRPRITVIGVGGAGGNAIANMMEADIEGVDFIVANTDAQSLSTSPAEHRIQLGPESTGGLGAGARPELGKAAAEETVEQIEEALEGVNMCFIAAGMGGGTGTGAAPVIAEAARRKNVLTVGVVTKPFLFEGTRRMRAAEAGIEELQRHVDTLIVIPNQNLFLIAKPETTFKEAFRMADEVLQQGVRSITDLMVMPGLINLDFANPLLEGVSMAGAKGVIISIIGGEDMKLLEVDEAANHIRDLVDEDANIIWGSAFNPNLEGKIRVSVVATGIEEVGGSQSASPRNAMGASPEPRPARRPVLDFADRNDTGERGAEPQGNGPDVPQPFGESSSSDARGDADARMSSDYSEDYDEDGVDDVDGVVDPLAGLRNEDDEDAPAAAPEPSANAPFARPSGERKPFDGNPADEWGSASDDDDTLDLGEAQEAPPPSSDGSDELVLGEDAGEEAPEPEPAPSRGRRRGLVSGEGDAQRKPAPPLPQGGGGGTLFERMAKLSRGGAPEEDDDEDDDGSSLNIPRFLGRQNNQ